MAATLRASEIGLKIVDQERNKKQWKKDSFTWATTKAHSSVATLKRFWRRIPIGTDHFINICKAVGIENWEEIVDQSSPTETREIPEWFAYDEMWVGREELVTELIEEIQVSCRLFVLLGISGIGKTALAECLTVELQETFLQGDWTKFQQENFEHDQQSSDFYSVAIRWLQKWGQFIPSKDSQGTDQVLDPKKILAQLVQYLEKHPYLIVMDSVENILVGNEQEGWNDFKDELWGKFFETFLALKSCKSRIIITSQYLPNSLPARYKNFFQCQVLSGLTASEQLALFEKIGLEITPEIQPYLERIGKAYEGHPLALRVIAGEIGNKPFFGNIVAYWNKYGSEIEEVEKAIAEAKELGKIASADDNWQLDRYTRQLRKSVRIRLEKTFNRLQQDFLNAYRLICEASVYRCPVSEKFWLSHLEDWDCNPDEQELALEALRDRYLVEEVVENDQFLLRQHNLIRSVALDHRKQLEDEND
ncbi:NB-ARC domain-containing protein [Planktothrix rubescens]|uniref:NB-ARC domain-containing protein n=1 Tax=Planktothrix rubescens TaxID=59512 RepID=UPI00042208F1|nr:NB-ARC domain-containing protein [Planktothrix rubescens]